MVTSQGHKDDKLSVMVHRPDAVTRFTPVHSVNNERGHPHDQQCTPTKNRIFSLAFTILCIDTFSSESGIIVFFNECLIKACL